MKKLLIISVCLVVVNILVYLVCLFDGGRLYSAGCLDANAILGNREYGRIVWAMFLHASTDHLFSNMIITLFLGIFYHCSGRSYKMTQRCQSVPVELYSDWMVC